MIVVVTLSPRDYDAVLFDLDGVLTRTARVHAAAWKKLFDSFLKQRATQAGGPFVPFDIGTDYPRYVDGKPSYDGVADFLESRGVARQGYSAERGRLGLSRKFLSNFNERCRRWGQHPIVAPRLDSPQAREQFERSHFQKASGGKAT